MQIKFISFGLIAAVFILCAYAEASATAGGDVAIDSGSLDLNITIDLNAILGTLIQKRSFSIPVKVATNIRRRALLRRGEEADEIKEAKIEDEEATAGENITMEDSKGGTTDDSDEESSEDYEEENSDLKRRSVSPVGDRSRKRHVSGEKSTKA